VAGPADAWDQRPTLDEAVANMMARVAANPYAEGVRIERGDVEPWPFGALVG
jgi:hypothetical protein